MQQAIGRETVALDLEAYFLGSQQQALRIKCFAELVPKLHDIDRQMMELRNQFQGLQSGIRGHDGRTA